MKFEDALKAMRDGKPVRRPCMCYFIMDKCVSDVIIINAAGDTARLTPDDIVAEDWEVIDQHGQSHT